jgi:hypothetical protein
MTEHSWPVMCAECVVSRCRKCTNILVRPLHYQHEIHFRFIFLLLPSLAAGNESDLLAIRKTASPVPSNKFFALSQNWIKQGRPDVADYHHESNSVPNSLRHLPSYWFHPLIFRKEIKPMTGDQLSLSSSVWQITRLSWPTFPTNIRIICFLAEVI